VYTCSCEWNFARASFYIHDDFPRFTGRKYHLAGGAGNSAVSDGAVRQWLSRLAHATLFVTTPMPLTRTKSQLMSASEIDRTLVRLAHEILEKNTDLDRLAFIGIRRRGVPLAQRLAQKIEALEKRAVPVGILDINLYRDDLTTVDVKPVVSATEIAFSVQGKDIILMDDVLYTVRTIRAALDALFDHGRPARVHLLVLIDRGHRELPIEAQFVGRTVQTSDDEIIEVKFQEIDQLEKVLMVERVSESEAV
jgi:pyrimidine operon attenuation protein/uracil phosphoribosyltransferase